MSLLLLFTGHGFISGVIGTGNYSQHPINCMMSGTEVLKEGWKRTVEWNVPEPNVKQTATATKTATRKIVLPPMRRLTRGGWN